ncbi:MAG: hypothetical protein WAN65_23925 [Candidatus Sulfotelmatobacter sp.]
MEATRKTAMCLSNGPLDEQEERRNPLDDDDIEKAKKRQQEPEFPNDGDKQSNFPI